MVKLFPSSATDNLGEALPHIRLKLLPQGDKDRAAFSPHPRLTRIVELSPHPPRQPNNAVGAIPEPNNAYFLTRQLVPTRRLSRSI